MRNFTGIHPTALIGDGVELGKNVVVGPGAVLYDNVKVGDGAIIGAQCLLGEPQAGLYDDPSSYANPVLEIGAGARIRSGTIIYAGTRIGPSFECGHRVTIREGADIGRNVRIGTLSDIQGHCRIGDYVRLHSNVHIGHKSDIGDYVWIFPYVVLTNDPHPPSNHLVGVTVEPFAVIATMTVVLPGVRIGGDALVGASSLVRGDVAPEAVVVGNPAKQVAMVRDIRSRFDGAAVYPWREHFERGMPWEGIGYAQWDAERRGQGA